MEEGNRTMEEGPRAGMRAAIVGSRDRGSEKDRILVENLVNSLPDDAVVVSGGCRGVDTWAEESADKRGLKVLIFRPNIVDAMTYGEKVQQFYRRNREIVDNSDVVYALMSRRRKGGTGYTVDYAKSKGKKVNLL